MPNFNLCIFEGHLGRAAEKKTDAIGEYAELSLAINAGKDKKPMWISCKVRGKSGDYAASICNKGDAVRVAGKIYWDPSHEKKTHYLDVREFSWIKKAGTDTFEKGYVGSDFEVASGAAKPVPAADGLDDLPF